MVSLKPIRKMTKYRFNTIGEAVEDIRKGKMIVVVDDEDRENEGDLVIAAEKATPAVINFMAKYGGGLICLPMMRERLEELHIERMVAKNTDPNRTAFTVSIDAAECKTGISAQERALIDGLERDRSQVTQLDWQSPARQAIGKVGHRLYVSARWCDSEKRI